MNTAIKKLIQYGIEKGLMKEVDKIYITNALLELFQLDDYKESLEEYEDIQLEEVLNEMNDYAFKRGILSDNSTVSRDLFETKIMGLLVPRPSEIIKRFHQQYQVSPKDATDYFYKLNIDNNYIRKYRIEKDRKWFTTTDYGKIEVIVHISKQELDLKNTSDEKEISKRIYPKCFLCKENEGYAGRIDHPARQNHRIIPLSLNKEIWGLQYSPYAYYNEHCIVLNNEHVPMNINKATFRKLIDFIKIFPHYFIASNADLPIVGDSILDHEHYQGGNYEFALAKAKIEERFVIKGFEDVEVGIVKWPMSVLRIKAKDDMRLIEIADKILREWKDYTDQSAYIFSNTDGVPHNSITPIARKTSDLYELDIVLRNNITTELHPHGVFHPHEDLHHIKKDNIGLVEVMGLAILPSRLNEEMNLLKEYIISGKDILSNEKIAKHFDWVNDFRIKYSELNQKNIEEVLQTEISILYMRVLEHAAVFKRNKKGHDAFVRFIMCLSND